jgi:Rps23 Pro-64 3,4-dihydroxylase Tpa1-like proline 4-hydroxylase
MIKKYSNVLSEDTLEVIELYIQHALKNDVWASNLEWDKRLVNSSSIVITHPVSKKEIFFEEVKNQIQKILNVNFDSLNLEFRLAIYIWGKMSYITWHDDYGWDYSGTIYLNKEWNLNYGGIFLWKDNKNSEIRGVEPIFNSMVVNSKHQMDGNNLHAVTMLSSESPENRFTLQWRCVEKKKIKKIEYL